MAGTKTNKDKVMKITKSQLKHIIKEELDYITENPSDGDAIKYVGPAQLGAIFDRLKTDKPPAQYEEDEQWDLENHLLEKFKNAIAISLEKGLTADAVQTQFDNALDWVTTHGRDMREP